MLVWAIIVDDKVHAEAFGPRKKATGVASRCGRKQRLSRLLTNLQIHNTAIKPSLVEPVKTREWIMELNASNKART